MKNIKVYTLLVLLLSAFSCEQTLFEEDTSPQEIRSTSNAIEEDPVEQTGPSTLQTMAVSVRFNDPRDRDLFRAEFSLLLEVHSWNTCVNDADLELWTVDKVSEKEFNAIVLSMGDFTVIPPPSAGNAGATVGWTSANLGPNLNPIFYLYKVCF